VHRAVVNKAGTTTQPFNVYQAVVSATFNSSGRIAGYGSSIDVDRNTGTGEVWSNYHSGNAPSYFNGGVQFDLTHSNGGTQEQLQLDAYEEGTFTPTITGATSYTTQFGSYIKIGNVVYFQIFLRISAITESSAATQISGLPFPSSSSASKGFGGAWVSYGSVFVDPASTATIKWHIGSPSTSITAYGGTNQRAAIATNNALWSWLDPQRISLQGFYTT
jgi:hypothetical protein